MAYWQVQYYILDEVIAWLTKKKASKPEGSDFLRVLLIDLLALKVYFPFDMIINTQVKQTPDFSSNNSFPLM